MPRVYDTARATILAALPGTRVQIQARTGFNRSTVQRWIKRMHGDEVTRLAGLNECFIIDWKRPLVHGPFSPVYFAGKGPDVPCILLCQSKSESWQKQKIRHQESEINMHNVRCRARYWARKAARGNQFQLQSLFFAKPKPSKDVTAKD